MCMSMIFLQDSVKYPLSKYATTLQGHNYLAFHSSRYTPSNVPCSKEILVQMAGLKRITQHRTRRQSRAPESRYKLNTYKYGCRLPLISSMICTSTDTFQTQRGTTTDVSQSSGRKFRSWIMCLQSHQLTSG
jgi:hypothetical protein